MQLTSARRGYETYVDAVEPDGRARRSRGVAGPVVLSPKLRSPACGPDRECPSGLICSTQLFCEEEGSTTPDAAADGVLDGPNGGPKKRTRAGLIGLWE